MFAITKRVYSSSVAIGVVSQCCKKEEGLEWELGRYRGE